MGQTARPSPRTSLSSSCSSDSWSSKRSSDSESERVHGAQYNSLVTFDLPQPVAGTRLSCMLPGQLDSAAHIVLSDHSPVTGAAPLIRRLSLDDHIRRRKYCSPHTFVAKAQPSDSWGERVFVKYAVNEAVDALEQEAALYFGPLRRLWDKAVPKCLGFFHGRTKKHTVACLVLEYCAFPLSRGLRCAQVDYREIA